VERPATSPASHPARVGESLPRELHALPAPRHLHEYLTGSLHLHLGFFERPDESLSSALDRLVLRDARLLARNSLIGDIGCGLGGTTGLLAAQGHRVFGIDPCPRSIDYARKRVATPRAQFLTCGLEAFAERARGARFDALVLVEVLSSFPDLTAMLGACRALLRPGGLVLVHDLARAPSVPETRGSAHLQGALRNAADAGGYDLLEGRDLTNRITPTLPRLGRLLQERRADLLRVFGPTRPAIEAEIEAYQAHLRALEYGFASQELTFESSILRCSARLGSDSVVLRPRTRAVPVVVRREPRPEGS